MTTVPAKGPADAALARRRAQIRRGLRRANTAGVLILLIVIGLSAAALFQALRAERNAHTAETASARAQDELWHAQLARARAERLSGVAGSKDASLKAVASAARFGSSQDLKAEAIAALALTDVIDANDSPHLYGGLGLAFAPDLERAAWRVGPGKVTVSRTQTDEPLLQFQGPLSLVTELQFSPDGLLLVAVFQNGEVNIWSLTNQSTVMKWKSGRSGSQLSLAFSPESRLLAIADETPQVRFLDLLATTELSPLQLGEPAGRVAFRPDGNMLALSVSNRIELWRWPKRELAQSLAHPAKVLTFAWHPDSQRLAATCSGGFDIYLWDTYTERHRVLRGHTELVPHLVFDHRGSLLASYSWDGSTRFWQANDGELLFTSRTGFGVAFDTNDTRMAYVREQRGFGVWNVRHSTVYRELQMPIGAAHYITAFDFSPDRHSIAAANPDGLHLFDLDTGRESSSMPLTNNIRAIAYTPDGTSLVVAATDQMALWHLPSTGEPEWRRERLFDLPASAMLDHGSVTRGQLALLALPAKENVFWVDLANTLGLSRLNAQSPLGPMTCAAISGDRHWVATTCWKGRGTFVWETATGAKAHDLGPDGGIVSFSPDNRWLLVGAAHAYALWDTQSWQRLWQLERHTAGELVGAGVFSPDASLIAICPDVNQLQLIETGSGRVLARLTAPTQKNIGWVGFSSDGTTLCASTFDNRLQLWNLPLLRKELGLLALPLSTLDEVESASATQGSASGSSGAPFAAAPVAALRTSTRTFYLLDGLGVITAVLIGLYTWRYHQRMVYSYEDVEKLVAQRNQELEIAQMELLHSQKMKALGTLAAGIAHDFNNLLSVIRMGNNFLCRPDTSTQDKAESSRAIERAVEQGKKVVHSMLGYSREQAEVRQTFSVPELVDEVVLLLSQQFLSGLTLTLELNRDLPLVDGSRGRLEQILLNLLVNASEAMNGKGRLRISVDEVHQTDDEFVLRPRPAASFVELAVADSGPGITPEFRQRIFEPFFSTKPRGASSGTGLGLSLVHGLAQQEGFGIRLESTPGKGTAFTILVPLTETPPAAEGQAELDEPNRTALLQTGDGT
jgi:signal transduction histidine kinase